ncbi:hypothetical protein ACFE04_017784 [Oxalis oulophora]
MASESKSSVDVGPSNPKSGSAVCKTTEIKSKTTSSSSKTTAKTTTKVREKKTFTLPGQKHDVPEEICVWPELKHITGVDAIECSLFQLSRFFVPSGKDRIPAGDRIPSLSAYVELMWLLCAKMMEHGLLPADRAKKAYERKQAKQKNKRMGTPIKPEKPSNNPECSNKRIKN